MVGTTGGAAGMQSHRPGSLKQANKSHKGGRHRARTLSDKGGRVSSKSLTRRHRNQLGREERRHQAVQLRRSKWEDILAKKRGLGGAKSAPFLTCVIPLNAQLDCTTAIGMLSTCHDEAIQTVSRNGVVHISLSIFKQRFSFVCPEVENEFETLDALKVADSVLFLTSAVDEPIDEWGEKILASAIGQGMPSPTVAVMDIESLNPKKRTQEKQNVQKLISKWLPEEKIFQLDKNSDALNLLRRIGNLKRKYLHYREKRPYMLAEDYEYVSDPEGDNGTLRVTGYLKGVPLSVNSLIHIPYLGNFQMSHILAPNDPHPLEKNKNNDAKDVEMSSDEVKVLETANPALQVSLISENVPDPMDAEQTWPNEEEIAKSQAETKKSKKIPEGMSDYQATWILDSDGESGSEYSGDEDQDDFMSCDEEGSDNENENQDDDLASIAESEVAAADDKYDETMNETEEQEMLEKIKAARSDQQFPDEIDTPDNVPARERFQKYRGLESFRTSAWDPKENLPLDYARIFQFKNYDHTRKRILKESEDGSGALPGWFVTICITNVPKSTWTTYTTSKSFTSKGSLIVFGLYPHEHKMSVVNVVLKRTGVSDEPIKSKERLLIQSGFRRYIVSPIFSQHTNGSKHKYERFFQPASTCVATFFAPIQFNPSPILCYQIKNDKPTKLIATGCVLSCNPDRLNIKRIVLSGHPLKVHKRSAVIRFMFFNRDDVQYFKPCKLRTKYGRTGHIKESLGTHGHMKCVFDAQLKSQDTVLLSLYKRVFPKWNYVEWILNDEVSETLDAMQL